MNLLISYPPTQNHGFNFVYKDITEKLLKKYSDYNIEINNCEEIKDLVQHAAYCGGCNLSIINKDTQKCVLLSFADIAEVHVLAGHGFDKLSDPVHRGHGFDHVEIMEIYGGLAWSGDAFTAQEISDKWNIRYIPFQYPLPYDDFEEYVEKNRTIYNPTEKIRKAIFLGMFHPERAEIIKYLSKHPLFEIPDTMYPRQEYWNEMSKYAMILSLNGNGEFCVRDVEGYGLGIPTIRSEIKARMRYHELQPNVHYIRGSQPSDTARLSYSVSMKEIAEQFIDKTEKTMYDDELLINISENGVNYYEKYCKFNYISNLFVDLFDPLILL
jgi:hypothetical protein